MPKIFMIVAGVLVIAGAAFAMKSVPTGAQGPKANASAFELMSNAKGLPVAPNPDAF